VIEAGVLYSPDALPTVTAPTGQCKCHSLQTQIIGTDLNICFFWITLLDR